ncbi:threonine/homoserine/homoserine lactone efflux protein [Constrictibacter sp. MBR-5]|uniref:LysE family translocator n=1 Tax=Constrictibacter sp. MBR-5 TaxID=3156467 RepID=UPI00339571F5
MNPKTAAFFLAFVPQFVEPAKGDVALQFMVLGLVSVTLNALADIVVAFAAGRVREGAASRPGVIRRLREASGGLMIALGVGLAVRHRRTDAARHRSSYWAGLIK